MTEEKKVTFDHYHDRGIKKWAGFYLSEHTSALAHLDKTEFHHVPQKTRLSTEEITFVLNQAILKSRQVSLQKEEVNLDGEYAEDLVGLVEGHDSLGIYIAGEKIGYDEIRHVEFYEFRKWSAV